MSDVVLDASALLALLQAEPGSEVVALKLADSVMCTVNHSEVVAKLADLGMPAEAIHEALNLPIELVDFDQVLAMRAGMLRPPTRDFGLSLGDRACLALALERGVPALTAEAAWAEVPNGPRVELIRSRHRAKSAASKSPRRRR